MQLRKSLLEDAPQIAEVFQAAVAGTGDAYTEDQRRVWSESLDVAGAHALLDSRRRITWVAEDAAGLHGFVTLDGNTLHMLYVRPDAQGQGVGAGLLGIAERAAIAMDRSHIVLHSSQTALPFFKAQGYKLKSIEATSLDGVPFTRMFMRKTFEAR